MDSMSANLKAWADTHYGIHISDHQLEHVMHRVNELMSTHEMTASDFLLSLNSANTSLIEQIIEIITVPESYFFRDASLFTFLKNKLLPELIHEKRKQEHYEINILSAGCSCGEEIYSIAIYLHQLIPDIKRWCIHLLATDINRHGLEKARKGIFTKSSMRATDSRIINKYFRQEESFYILDEVIRNMVKFEYGNMAHMPIINQQFDLISCRNVFIYLNKTIIEKALNFFYEHLVNEGILLLSPADFFTHRVHTFSLKIVNDICLLKKERKIEPPPSHNDKKENEIFASYSDTQKERAAKLHGISLFLDEKNYIDALKNIDIYTEKYGSTALLYRYKGEVLLGLGDNTTALFYLTKAIKCDDFDATAHFLKGLIEMDMKTFQEAEISFKKALTVKPNFPEAAYYLGLYYLQNKQKEEGLKLLLRALNDAKKIDKEKTMLFSKDTASQFIQAVNSNILYYQGIKNG